MSGSGPTLPSAGSASSTVRDFIYLDESKVFSYLAQIEGGLRLLGQKVESALDISSTESGGDKKSGQHNAEGSISPTAAAAAQMLSGLLGGGGAMAPGLLAGLGGKYTYQRSWEQGSDVLKSESRDGSSSSDLSILHHAAFDLVMKECAASFLVVKGRVSVLTLDLIEGILSVVEGIEPATEKGFQLLKTLGIRNVCYVEGTRNVHAFLDTGHFIIPANSFIHTYGSPSEIDFTVVGILAQNPHHAHTRIAPQQAISTESKELFRSVNQGLDHIFGLLGAKSGSRLYPIAIYREL